MYYLLIFYFLTISSPSFSFARCTLFFVSIYRYENDAKMFRKLAVGWSEVSSDGSLLTGSKLPQLDQAIADAVRVGHAFNRFFLFIIFNVR